MVYRAEFRDTIAGRLLQFFGTPVPTAEELYTRRGMMAAEVPKEMKLSQAAAHRGQAHTPRLPA
eukprot:2888079-Heterocapsa_arctica.AAC.1